jgi:hypothetical protein
MKIMKHSFAQYWMDLAYTGSRYNGNFFTDIYSEAIATLVTLNSFSNPDAVFLANDR